MLPVNQGHFFVACLGVRKKFPSVRLKAVRRSYFDLTMTTSTPSTEAAEALFQRRLAAVTRSFEDYHAYLLAYLHGLTRQYQDAENLVQDLWKHVLLNFEEDQIHSLPLLRRKGYQLFIDHYRRQKRRGEIVTDEIPEVLMPSRPFVDQSEEGEATLRARFWSEYPGIDLTEPQKEAIWLHARYGYSFKEVSERLKAPASTIGDWITLARKKLAAAINNPNHK